VSFTHRPAAPADAQAVADLVADHDVAHHAALDRLSERDILDWWERIAESDAVVVTDERGRRRIGLGVDAENPTGATQLYERVGMRASSQDDVYEKSL
jgi:hypothetical protein